MVVVVVIVFVVGDGGGFVIFAHRKMQYSVIVLIFNGVISQSLTDQSLNVIYFLVTL